MIRDQFFTLNFDKKKKKRNLIRADNITANLIVYVHLFSWVHISTQTEEWVIQWDSESQEHRVCPHDEHIMQFSQLTSNEWTCQTHESHGYCMMLPWQHSSVLCGLNGRSRLSWLPKQWGLTAMWPPDSSSIGEEQRFLWFQYG